MKTFLTALAMAVVMSGFSVTAEAKKPIVIIEKNPIVFPEKKAKPIVILERIRAYLTPVIIIERR